LVPITITSEESAIEPGFHAEDEGFGGRRGCGGREQVVGQLHGLAHAGLLADEERLADHRQRGLQLLEAVARAGIHHGERALLGAADPAAHRQVDAGDVLGLERLGDARRHARAGGREIEEALDLPALDHAVLAGHDRQHDVRRGQARHHGLDLVGDVARRFRRDRAERGQARHHLPGGVVDDELVSRLDEAAGHRIAHVAETDEADIHDVSSIAVVTRYFLP
jgi:hypothetical protein